MSLSAADVRFLLNITHRMAERRLHAYVPGDHRSAVAVILRFGDEKQQRAAHRLLACQCTEHSSSELMQHLTSTTDAVTPSSLRMLFVRRADLSSDRWSGNVTFPGGRRDKDDADDMHTVYREVNEMLGIPLRSREFLFMGRLRDYPIRSRHIHAGGVVQSRFVFLHIGDLTPTLRFARHVVDSVQWMPISAFTAEHLDRGLVCHPVGCFVRPFNADSRLLLAEVFPHAYLAFPSVQPPGQWRVWGLALRTTGELLSLDGRPPIDWPLVSSNSALLQHFVIDAFHGCYEVIYAYHCARARLRLTGSAARTKLDVLPPCADSVLWALPERIEPRHIFFFCIDLVLVVVGIYTMASVIVVVSTTFCMALGLRETDGTKERLHAYYVENTVTGMEREQWDRQRLRQEMVEMPEGNSTEFPVEPATLFPVLPTTLETNLPLHTSLFHALAEKRGVGDDEDNHHTCDFGIDDHNDDNALQFTHIPSSDDWNAFRQTVRRWAEQNDPRASMERTLTGKNHDCNDDNIGTAERAG